jgi:quercetin dioxygenase-like cupin family protein
MSIKDVIYRLEITMADKHFSIKAADGASYFVIGDIITVKITGEETGGAYLAVEVVSQPGGGPYFLHTHEPQETFYVLEGVFEVYGQDASGEKYAIRADAGDTVQVPGGVPHGFKNAGDTPGRMLLIYEPAAAMLQFFQEIGVPMPDRTTAPDMSVLPPPDEILTILRKYMTLVEVPG